MLDELVPACAQQAPRSIDDRRPPAYSPLTVAQRRLWILAQLEPASFANNMSLVLAFNGGADRHALGEAIGEIVRRHDVLRSTIVLHDGDPARLADDAFVPLVDHRRLEEGEDRTAACVAERARAFDLMAAPPLRAMLLTAPDAPDLLVITIHRIAADRRSLTLFERELAAAYADLLAGRRPTLPRLWSRYDEFAALRRRAFEDEEALTAHAYWTAALSDVPERLELPITTVTGADADAAARVTRTLDRKLGERLRALAAASEIDLFDILAGAFSVLLYRYTGETDVVLGVPIVDRPRVGFDTLIGLFSETLPLRIRVAADRPFLAHARVVHEIAVASYPHRHTDFDRLTEELRPPHGTKRDQFSSVGFALRDRETPTAAPFVRCPEYESTAQFDVNLTIETTATDFACGIEYRASVLRERDVAVLLAAYETLLASLCADPGCSIARLQLVDTAGKREQTVAWNDTVRPYDERCVHVAFESHAAHAPDGIALVDGAVRLTNRELNEHANRLARSLQARGVGRGSRVAVCFERSANSVISVLAVAKTGAGYVPLDPEYPPDRLLSMTAAANASVVITSECHASRFSGGPLEIVRIDADAALLARYDGTTNPAVASDPEDLLCILYTSGSTGTPKGVQLPHRAIGSTVTGTDIIALERDDVVAHASAVTFDVGAFEIWLSLMNGGRLVVVPKPTLLEPALLQAEIAKHAIDVLCMTPAMFHEVARTTPGAFAGLRRLFIGGDVLSVEAVRRVQAAGGPERLGHMWGPTEATSYSTCHFVTSLPEPPGTLTLGRPMQNNTVYILDRDLNLLPVGVPGQMYVGGPGLALGYLDPAMTQAKFIPHPFEAPGAVLYATGDAGRFAPNGEIDFLGRIDRQIKIRGFRIEPGEIEAQLRAAQGVADAVIVVHGESNEKRLLAYVSPKPRETVDPDGVLAALRAKLPAYMIPDRVLVLAEFPMTSTGKIDRKALPQPPPRENVVEGSLATEEWTEVERQLAVIWQRLLGVSPVGLRDSFFDLGGHSLLAVRLMGEIETSFGKRLALTVLFERPTIAHLAAALLRDGDAPNGRSVLTLNADGTKLPIFFLHGSITGGGYYCRNLARMLGEDQPLVLLRPHGVHGDVIPETIETIAADYIARIKIERPIGPYTIGGFSAGGIVAYEIAQQLRAAGEDVRRLLVLDACGRNPRIVRIASGVDRTAEFFQLGRETRARLIRTLVQAPFRTRRFLAAADKRAFLTDAVAKYTGRLLGATRSAALSRAEVLAEWVARTEAYVPRPYQGAMTFLAASENPATPDNVRAWQAIVPELEVRYLSGDHHGCIVEHIDETARVLAAALA